MKKSRHFDKEYKPKCYKCGKVIKELIEFNWFRETQNTQQGILLLRIKQTIKWYRLVLNCTDITERGVSLSGAES